MWSKTQLQTQVKCENKVVVRGKGDREKGGREKNPVQRQKFM